MNNKADNTVIVRAGLGLGDAVFIVFLILKLLGKITWSWWWVTAPLWGPIALFVGISIIALAIAGLIDILTMIFRK